jgi:polyhydroxyalkanoate synthesis repressor PhaR
MARVIKKYANRRLYDTEISKYITLEQLKDLIVSGESIRVTDAKSGKDLTREVLLQLVAEQESAGRPILNEAILISLIRYYDHPLQKLASAYLEAALGQLREHQHGLSRQMQEFMESPADAASRLTREATRQNLEWMEKLQQSFLDAIAPRRTGSDRRKD